MWTFVVPFPSLPVPWTEPRLLYCDIPSNGISFHPYPTVGQTYSSVSLQCAYLFVITYDWKIVDCDESNYMVWVPYMYFHAPDLKGLPWASSYRIVSLSVHPFVHNSIPLYTVIRIEIVLIGYFQLFSQIFRFVMGHFLTVYTNF